MNFPGAPMEGAQVRHLGAQSFLVGPPNELNTMQKNTLSAADKPYNRSFDDTSMKFGRNTHWGVDFKKKVLAT